MSRKNNLEEAYKTMCELNADPVVSDYITRRMIYECDVATSKNKMYEEGLEKGVKVGHKQGIKQGELKKQKEIVISMHNNNIDIELISDITSLSPKEINDIIASS